MAIEVVAKKWGNSLGIILPKEVVNEQAIKENDTFRIEIVRVFDAKAFRKQVPVMKFKRSAQQLKDLAREGWQ